MCAQCAAGVLPCSRASRSTTAAQITTSPYGSNSSLPGAVTASAANDNTFVAPANCEGAEVRLLLRYGPGTSVWFDEVSLVETEAPAPRRIRVGTMRYHPPQPATAADHVRLYAEQIDRLGAARPDVIVLPEFANTASLPTRHGVELWQSAEAIPGEFCAMLAAFIAMGAIARFTMPSSTASLLGK